MFVNSVRHKQGVTQDWAGTGNGRHNFVEYPKAGREGKISTLPAQAVTGPIMYTLAAPGCQRVNKTQAASPKLSQSH